jgi:APA family basic amino acid/polyamine antiporter
LIWVVGPLAMLGTLILFYYLPAEAQWVFPIWGSLGLVFYFMYGYRKSHLALGIDPLASGEHLATEVGLQAEIAPNKDE